MPKEVVLWKKIDQKVDALDEADSTPEGLTSAEIVWGPRCWSWLRGMPKHSPVGRLKPHIFLALGLFSKPRSAPIQYCLYQPQSLLQNEHVRPRVARVSGKR